MYNPTFNRVDDADAIAMLERSGFGHLVSAGRDGLSATGLPFLVDRNDDENVGREVGGAVRLRAHFARANHHWRDLDGADVLIVFPLADGYVSPAWYPSKADDGRVVPTWNYEVVHVHGRVTVHDDADWVRTLVTELTDRQEQQRNSLDPALAPWRVDDAPAPYAAGQIRAIVGIEVSVDRIEGKRKLSQNRSDADRAGVVDGLTRTATPAATDLAAQMHSAADHPTSSRPS